MSLQRNYYEVLGIPQEATTDQIKKKYRELARKFHPDVVKDKDRDMGQRVFSQINQAYRILGDPERRAQYNNTLSAGTASGNGTANGTGPYSQNQAAQAQATQNQPTGRSQINGTAQARPVETQGQPPPAQKTQAISGLLSNADNAIMAGKPVEARAFCVKVLEIDPRSVRALDILGDALAQMGQREEAAVQYRKALQITPSHSIQTKLARMEQAAPSTRTIPPGQAAAPTQPQPPKRPLSSPATGEKAAGLLGRFLGRK